MEAPGALLFATDFAPAARAARAHVQLLATSLDLPVHLAHVLPAHGHDADRGKAERGLDEIAAELSVPVVDRQVLFGSAAEALMHHADAIGCGWIVVGVSGHRVGGTVDTISRFARQAVWVSRPRADGRITRVLASEADSESVRDLCRRWDADLELMTVTSGELLLRRAVEIGADLLVLERAELRGLRRAYMGGVGERILHRSTCSVLMLPPRR